MGEKGNGKAFAGRADIDKLDDRKIYEFYVEEWGLWVHHRQLKALEREEWMRSLYHTEVGPGGERTLEIQAHKAQLSLVAFALCDENGTRLYADHEVDVLGQRNHRAIMQIYEDVALKNKIVEGAVEEAADFSEAARDVLPSSGSRSGSGSARSGSS